MLYNLKNIIFFERPLMLRCLRGCYGIYRVVTGHASHSFSVKIEFRGFYVTDLSVGVTAA